MKDNICLFSTTTKDLFETRINRALQLNISQLANSFNSLLEKHLVLSFPNQPNPNLETLQACSSKPTQFPKPIEDRTEKLVTQEIVGKSQGELSSSDRTGEPVKDEDKRVMKDHDRTGKLVKGEDKRVMKDHDRTGKPVKGSSHKVQEVGSLKKKKIVMMRISSIFRWMTRTLISTSPMS